MDVSNVALLLLSAPTPGVISSTYSIWVVFVNVSRTGTSALNFNCSSHSSRDLMVYGLMAEFLTCFDKPNSTIITNIYMQNDNHDFICRKYSSYFVTVSIFLFQGCHPVILMLLLAQCYKNILRWLQLLSFTFCDRSLFNSYRHSSRSLCMLLIYAICNCFELKWFIFACHQLSLV